MIARVKKIPAATGIYPWFVAVADFSGAGFPGLAVANDSLETVMTGTGQAGHHAVKRRRAQSSARLSASCPHRA
jgi:hypothetical protein